MSIKDVKVVLWGTTIGYLHEQENGLIAFQYQKDFINSGIEVAPIKMPLSAKTFSFPSLEEKTFSGLPGMIADSLPDKFGNIVIKSYLESQGRAENSLTTLEKLCYTGKRGMGALEFEPSANVLNVTESVDISALTKLASDILSKREKVKIKYDNNMIGQLMQGGSSVGGARAKTLIAWNPETNDIRSGQIDAGEGYEYWLLKFDAITNNKDKDTEPDNPEYTKIEYAYYLMAKQAGIDMSECRLLKENGHCHFMTKRFDRFGTKGDKLHMQSLCAIAHMDFNTPRIHSYEEAFDVMYKLKLSKSEIIQFFRRMVFSECAKNYDDHTKNVTFLMDRKGKWKLSPAYDETFSYNPTSIWVSAHQMLINGKAEDITLRDIMETAKKAKITEKKALQVIDEVTKAISMWNIFAAEAGLSLNNTQIIQKHLRTNIN